LVEAKDGYQSLDVVISPDFYRLATIELVEKK
jgi:hypothetical protein